MELKSKFLNIELAVDPYWVIILAPDVGTRTIAYQTRFDNRPGLPDGEFTATWMDQTWAEIPDSVKKAARTYWDWQMWEFSSPVTQKGYYDAYDFFSKLQESVVLAVKYTADAMQWVMDEVGSTYKCSLGVQDMMDQVSRQTTIGVVFMLVSYYGMNLIVVFMRGSEAAWIELAKNAIKIAV